MTNFKKLKFNEKQVFLLFAISPSFSVNFEKRITKLQFLLTIDFLVDVNATAVGVDLSSQSFFFTFFYPGGSGNGYFGNAYNTIFKASIDGVGTPRLVEGGIGQLGITSLAVDWIARKYN